jgi:hypothetical protein
MVHRVKGGEAALQTDFEDGNYDWPLRARWERQKVMDVACDFSPVFALTRNG